MMRLRTVAKAGGIATAALLVAGIAAPFVHADGFRKSIQGSLERALGRTVEIGAVRLNLFAGPGFELHDVKIHEDPAIGIEPFARVETMEVTPRLLPLLRGHFAVSSIRLDNARINLAKTGAPSEPGRWNFEGLLKRAGRASFPGVRIRNGRINFKFGDTKTTLYLMGTDLDISPSVSGREWKIECEAQPARTDRPAQGLGSFTAEGKWIVAAAGDRLDLDLRLERSGLGEITALLRGYDGGVHGTISSRLHLSGPLHDIRIDGRVTVEDVHRWDLLPPKGEGWPLDVRGRLNLVAQHLELESNSAGHVELPLFVRFRVNDYLSQPRWGLSVNWNRFPVEPLLELARHMGVQLPPKLNLTGAIDGAIGYSGQGSFQGQVNFQNTALTVPDSPPVRFDTASVLFGQGHVYLKPAQVHLSERDRATVEADYAVDAGTLDLQIGTEGMSVAALRSQVALAKVPWLEQVASGEWRGQLHYRHAPTGEPGWTGKLSLKDAVLAVPGLAGGVRLESARAQIDGARVVLDRIVATVGGIAVAGEYRYEPLAARPHRVRLTVDEVEAAALERQLAPTLRRSTSLLARAFGRATVPEWLRTRKAEGTLRIAALAIGDTRFENVRAHLLWDATRLDLNGIQARIEKGSVTGRLAVNLRGRRPVYRFTGRAKRVPWQSGWLDVEGTLESAGMGAELLDNLTAEGTFSGSGFDAEGPLPFRSASGAYGLTWSRTAPRLRFTDLELATEEETYTGRGETQEDGRLILVLTDGAREMRMSGTLARLRVDEPVRQ